MGLQRHERQADDPPTTAQPTTGTGRTTGSTAIPGGGPQRARLTARSPGIIGTIVVALAGLTGCSGGDDDPRSAVQPPSDSTTVGTGLPTTLDAPTSGATPTATLQPVPAEATAQTPEGAVAFLAWWVDMYNYVELTGEAELIKQHSTDLCVFCYDAIDRIQPVYDAGGRIERDGPTVFQDLEAERYGDNGMNIRFNGRSSVTRNLDAGGTVVDTFPESDGLQRTAATLQWSRDQWLLDQIVSMEG